MLQPIESKTSAFKIPGIDLERLQVVGRATSPDMPGIDLDGLQVVKRIEKYLTDVFGALAALTDGLYSFYKSAYDEDDSDAYWVNVSGAVRNFMTVRSQQLARFSNLCSYYADGSYFRSKYEAFEEINDVIATIDTKTSQSRNKAILDQQMAILSGLIEQYRIPVSKGVHSQDTAAEE